MSNAAVAADAPPAAKGKKKLLLIIVAAAVLLLGGGGTAALLLLKKKSAGDDGDDTAQVEAAEPKAKPTVRHDPKNPPAFAPLDTFTVNLADREVERYAQIALTLELDDPKTADAIKAFMPAIRNNILMVLAHKTSADILSADGKARLAGEIRRATSRALGVDVAEPDAAADADEAPTKRKKKKKAEVALPIVAVHFSNFIVQ